MNLSYEHRKSRICIYVTYRGKPAVDRDIHFSQKRHEFLFGCGAFESINRWPAENESKRNLYKTVTTESEAEFYRERMEMWLELFNYGTMPFYWGKYEPTEGETIADQVMEASVWLRSRGITLKGHPLCWHTNSASWLLKYPEEEIMHRQRERVAREVKTFRGIIDKWDVINEVVIMPEFTRYDNPITRICKAYGRVETVRAMFAEAAEANPNAQLLINDFNTSEKYEELIARCLDAGIPISAIGIQSHQHQGYWGDEKLLSVLERFSRFGLPIHFTENTFTSGHIMPQRIVDLNDYMIPSWPSTEEGLQRQAENIERFYRILFACPQVEAITTWAFQDGAWLGAPAGMVTVENKKKPSFYTLKKLLKNEWWTDVTLHTDANGFVELNGYRGTYIAKMNDCESEFNLSNVGELSLEMVQ